MPIIMRTIAKIVLTPSRPMAMNAKFNNLVALSDDEDDVVDGVEDSVVLAEISWRLWNV